MWARVGIIGNPPRLALSRDIFNLMIYAARNEELSIGCAQEELRMPKRTRVFGGETTNLPRMLPLLLLTLPHMLKQRVNTEYIAMIGVATSQQHPRLSVIPLHFECCILHHRF